MSRKVRDIAERYNQLSPTRNRSMSLAAHSPRRLSPPTSAPTGRNIVGCVGRKDVMFLKITYYVNVCNAQKTQAETKITDGVTDKPWFSDEDFEELTQTIKHSNDSYDVCIFAQPGSEFFRYCTNYKNPCLQVVDVSLYKEGKFQYDEGIMDTINQRWAGQYSVISGALPSGQ